MMEALLGMRVRDRDGIDGCVSGVADGELQIEWTHLGVLMPARERLSTVSSRAQQLQALTLTEGWKPMSELIRESGSAPMSLLEDLQSLLQESTVPEELDEAAKRKSKKQAAASKKGRGKDLEKKAREKRHSRSKEVVKKRGGGHNPFKTKKKLGPGPRHGTNSESKHWKCRCASPYKCLCRSADGHRKVVTINKGYKHDYNKDYKAWRKHQKH